MVGDPIDFWFPFLDSRVPIFESPGFDFRIDGFPFLDSRIRFLDHPESIFVDPDSIFGFPDSIFGYPGPDPSFGPGPGPFFLKNWTRFIFRTTFYRFYRKIGVRKK